MVLEVIDLASRLSPRDAAPDPAIHAPGQGPTLRYWDGGYAPPDAAAGEHRVDRAALVFICFANRDSLRMLTPWRCRDALRQDTGLYVEHDREDCPAAGYRQDSLERYADCLDPWQGSQERVADRSLDQPPATVATTLSDSLPKSEAPAVPSIKELLIQRLTPRPRTEPCLFSQHSNPSLGGRRKKSLSEAQLGHDTGLAASGESTSAIEKATQMPAASEGLDSEQGSGVPMTVVEKSEAGADGKQGDGIAEVKTTEGKVSSNCILRRKQLKKYTHKHTYTHLGIA